MNAVDTSCPKCGSKTKSNGWRRGLNRRRCAKCGKGFSVDPNRDPIDDQITQGPGLYIDGNSAVLISEPRATKPTLEAIIHDYSVDLDTWQVEKWGVKEFTTTMKLRTGGKNGNDNPVRCVNYSVQVRFVRRVPTHCEWPTVRPAKLPKVVKTAAVKLRGGLKRKFVYADAQIGYLRDVRTDELTPLHDESALAVAGEILRELQPDGVIGLGDLVDFSEQSTHWIIKPEYAYQTNRALDRAVAWLHSNRGYAGTWDEIQGNHDYRITANVIQNLSASYALRPGLLPDEDPAREVYSPESLLRLDELGIDYHGPYPSGEVWINDNLVAVHGERGGSKPGQTAQRNLDSPRCSQIMGHWHRNEMAHTTAHHHGGQKTYAAHVVGCLCRIDGTVPGKNARPNWQQSVAVIEHDETFFQVYHIPIYNGRAIWSGKTYESERAG